MYDMLRTIEFLGHHILKNDVLSMELLSFHNKMTRKKVILVTGLTARKRSEGECLLRICQILLNYMYDILRTIEFLGHPILKNEIVSMELLSFQNKMTKKKMILVIGVSPRKQSESECLLQICQIW